MSCSNFVNYNIKVSVSVLEVKNGASVGSIKKTELEMK